MIAAQKTPLRTLDDWLRHFGWQPQGRLRSVFTLATSAGEAVLQKLAAASASQWTTWTLGSPNLPLPQPGQLFAANREIQGPFKFAHTQNGEIRCFGDIPRDAFVPEDTYEFESGQNRSPIQSWAKTATALARGESPPSDPAKPTEESLVEWLKEQGYVASSDHDCVKVTVPLTGTFREVTVRWDAGGMVHLSAEVGRLKDLSDSSREAAWNFLEEANSRIRLVRIAEADEPLVFQMEAKFRAPGPGAWMQAALGGLCTGMALVVGPLASLREPGVADMLLAGKTAKRKDGAS